MDAELLKHMGDQVKEKKKPEGPRVLYGRKITGSTSDPIGDLNETSGRVCLEGFVLKKIESKELRGGSKTLVTFGVTDYTGSILCKVFLNAEQGEGKEIQGLKAGIRVRVRGACQWDSFSKEIALMAGRRAADALDAAPGRGRGQARGAAPAHADEQHGRA